MRLRKLWSVFTVIAVSTAGFVALAEGPAAAADRLPPTTASTDTKMRCRANAPVIGAVDADQTISVDHDRAEVHRAGRLVPARPGRWRHRGPDGPQRSDDPEPEQHRHQDPAHRWVHDHRRRPRRPGLLQGERRPRRPAPSPVASPSPTPRPTSRCRCPAPSPAAASSAPPNIVTTVTATGAPGTKINSKVAGTLTSANPTPPFADAGFGLTATISLGSVPTSCAPNYGTFANGNGEPLRHAAEPLVHDDHPEHEPARGPQRSRQRRQVPPRRAGLRRLRVHRDRLRARRRASRPRRTARSSTSRRPARRPSPSPRPTPTAASPPRPSPTTSAATSRRSSTPGPTSPPTAARP